MNEPIHPESNTAGLRIALWLLLAVAVTVYGRVWWMKRPAPEFAPMYYIVSGGVMGTPTVEWVPTSEATPKVGR